MLREFKHYGTLISPVQDVKSIWIINQTSGGNDRHYNDNNAMVQLQKPVSNLWQLVS